MAYECIEGARAFGVAHVEHHGAAERPVLRIWLEREAWGTPLELHCLKALLNRMGAQPLELDVHFGSTGHTRLAYALYKPHGFKPMVKPRVLMLRPQ